MERVDYRRNYHYMTQEERDLKRRRTKKLLQIKRRFRLMMFAVVMVATISILCASTRSKAETVHDTSLNVTYRSVMIQNGDSLWSIATEQTAHIPELNCKDYVKELKTINNLSKDDIQYGDYLIIPVYSYASTTL